MNAMRAANAAVVGGSDRLTPLVALSAAPVGATDAGPALPRVAPGVIEVSDDAVDVAVEESCVKEPLVVVAEIAGDIVTRDRPTKLPLTSTPSEAADKTSPAVVTAGPPIVRVSLPTTRTGLGPS